MLLRNKEQCIEKHKQLEAGLRATHESIAKLFEGGDYDMARSACDQLKVQLEAINQLSNHMADKGF